MRLKDILAVVEWLNDDVNVETTTNFVYTVLLKCTNRYEQWCAAKKRFDLQINDAYEVLKAFKASGLDTVSDVLFHSAHSKPKKFASTVALWYTENNMKDELAKKTTHEIFSNESQWYWNGRTINQK